MSFTLLTLPGVSLRTSTASEAGTLSVECLSDSQVPQGDPPSSSLGSDVTLAFQLNAHTILLERGSPVSLVISPSGQRTYSFEPLTDEQSDKKTATVRFTIPPPKAAGPFMAEDVETFDHLLVQYAELSWSYGDPDLPSSVPPPLPIRSRPPSPPGAHASIMSNVQEAKPVEDPSLRGRLVLMDDSSGEVVGEIPQSLNITEDPALAGKSTAPVVLELHPDMYDACTGVRELGAEGDDLLEVREVFARAVPPEEQDWLMKGATYVSEAISSSTSMLVSGITTVSNYYITHSTPGTPTSPSHYDSGSTSPSPPSTASSALESIYTLSGQVARTSARTADAVGNIIRYAVGGDSKDTASSTPASLVPGTPSEVSYTFPPAYAVYTPKHKAPPSRKDEKTSEAEGAEANEKKPLRTRDRVLLSANLVLTTVDDSARRMFEVGSDRLGAVVGHKFGPEAQHSTQLATHTARNIVLVYVDVRGFARRALITRTGKEFVKARFSGKKAPSSASTSNSPSGGASPNVAAATSNTAANVKA